MIERIFASIKIHIRSKFQNIDLKFEQLISAVSEFVNIHNLEMPLFKKNKTPHELYWNMSSSFNYKASLQIAIQDRIFINKNIFCSC